MDLTKLRHVVAVAQTGSFSRAAEEANITQPALSRSIAAFEAQHGARLFDRGRGGVVPTPAGRFVIDQARALLQSADELERNLRLYGQGAAGRVGVGLGPVMASLVLPRLSQILLSTRPNLQLIAPIKLPEELVADLLEGTIEVIIGNSWMVRELPGIVSETIGGVQLAVMVRAGHPLARQETVTRAELASYPVARPTRFAEGAPASTGAFICDNCHILRETVLATDCSWIAAPAFLADDLRAGRVAILRVTDFPMGENEICAITRTGRTRSPAAEAVIEIVTGMLAEIAVAERTLLPD